MTYAREFFFGGGGGYGKFNSPLFRKMGTVVISCSDTVIQWAKRLVNATVWGLRDWMKILEAFLKVCLNRYVDLCLRLDTLFVPVHLDLFFSTTSLPSPTLLFMCSWLRKAWGTRNDKE